MKEANDHHRGVIAWSLILGILIPVIPVAFQSSLIAKYGSTLSGAFIGTQITSMILSYTGLLFCFLASVYITLKNIRATNAFFWWAFYLLFVSGVIQTVGYGLWAPYNAIEAFTSPALPLLGIAYVNKRSGKQPWVGQFIWACILACVLVIAYIVVVCKFGWRGYMMNFAEVDKGNPELMSIGGIDSGTMLTYLIGLALLTIGVGVARRSKSEFGATEGLGIFFFTIVPFLYALIINSRFGVTDINTYFRCWTPYVTLSFIFILAVLGHWTEPWDKELYAPKGEEAKGEFGDIPDDH